MLGIALGVGLFVAIPGLGVLVGGALLCDNHDERTVVSPSGSRAVVMSIRDCGLTTNYAVSLSVDGWIRDRFVLFEPLLGLPQLEQVQLKWRGESAVEVSLPPDLRVHSMESRAGGVEIEYLPQASLQP